MSVLNADEQKLFNTAKASLPRLLFHLVTNPQEVLAAAAKVFNSIRLQIFDWVRFTYILMAPGFWLDQHAKDRGTSRRVGETDEALRTRLRTVEDLVTKPALLKTANDILVANGLPAIAAIVELRNDRAYFTTYDATIHAIPAADIADGETFVVDDLVLAKTYEFDKNASVGGGNIAVNIASAVTAQQVANAILAALTGAYTSQINPKNDLEVKLKSTTVNRGILLTEAVANTGFTVTSGRKHAYHSRGYRMGRRVNEIIVILPFGTTSPIAESVREAIRQKKAGGIGVFIEVRANP